MTRMRTVFVAMIGVLLSQGCENVTTIPSPPQAGPPPGWNVIAAGSTNLNAVSGISDTSVWVVGDQGTIAHWDGSQLTPETSGTSANLRGVWAVDAKHVYAVGSHGTIVFGTMGVYKLIPNADAENLLAVGGSAGGPAVAVGALGL